MSLILIASISWPPLFPFLVAEFPTQDFAGRGHRQAFNEFDDSRIFVLG